VIAGAVVGSVVGVAFVVVVAVLIQQRICGKNEFSPPVEKEITSETILN
jgi:hypothetical protein